MEENPGGHAPDKMTNHDVSRVVVDIKAQPDEASCGSTCLEAVYRYFGDDVTLESIVDEVRHLPDGGTFAVFLARHALERGYRATIYTYNLKLFDPSWFSDSSIDLVAKLERQREEKPEPKFRLASDGYIEFLRKGGEVLFEELNSRLLQSYFRRSIPVIAGVSATYLYRTPRELENRYDDVRGEASGHFVVLCGYESDGTVRIADPYARNPFGRHDYTMSLERLIGAIHLGVLTYDANLLVLEPDPDRQV